MGLRRLINVSVLLTSGLAQFGECAKHTRY
jgi:hypothetical protein